ncbi:hypothetical protein R3P38DRAFT_2988933 [Favolaschia claudopus]|uniref:Secreted protein n=1 Tax=Favolaschia claudopus TaxID=2862362 RepID=A0AAW0AUE9_9AGAR
MVLCWLKVRLVFSVFFSIQLYASLSFIGRVTSLHQRTLFLSGKPTTGYIACFVDFRYVDVADRRDSVDRPSQPSHAGTVWSQKGAGGGGQFSFLRRFGASSKLDFSNRREVACRSVGAAEIR